MRYIGKFGFVLLTTSLWMAATCAAQQTPGGSYQQTCRDIGTRGSTLFATCQDGSGGWRSTELGDFPRCSSEIQNINGQLQCSSKGGYQANGPQRGRDHDGDGDSGYGPGRGGDRDERHDRDHDANGNNGYYHWPNGSYGQTCQNISTNGNTLQASCKKKNGKWKQTSLRNYNQCRGEVVNNNGRLQCSR